MLQGPTEKYRVVVHGGLPIYKGDDIKEAIQAFGVYISGELQREQHPDAAVLMRAGRHQLYGTPTLEGRVIASDEDEPLLVAVLHNVTVAEWNQHVPPSLQCAQEEAGPLAMAIENIEELAEVILRNIADPNIVIGPLAQEGQFVVCVNAEVMGFRCDIVNDIELNDLADALSGEGRILHVMPDELSTIKLCERFWPCDRVTRTRELVEMKLATERGQVGHA